MEIHFTGADFWNRIIEVVVNGEIQYLFVFVNPNARISLDLSLNILQNGLFKTI